MKKNTLPSLAFAGMLTLVNSASAQDADQCLDCHEPAEDWAGMSVEEILVNAKNPDNKRHSDFADLSDDRLKAIITTLME